MSSQQHKIEFNFYYKKNLTLARLIRWATRGKWSHISVTIDGATWEAIGGRINRVVVSHKIDTYHTRKYAPDEIETKYLECTEAEKQAVKYYLISIEGQRYDVGGVLAYLWPGFKFSDKKHFCSEIGSRVVEILTGKKMSDKLVTPSELYDVINAISDPV